MTGGPAAPAAAPQPSAAGALWTMPIVWLFVALALMPLAAKLGAEGFLLSLVTRALIFAIGAL